MESVRSSKVHTAFFVIHYILLVSYRWYSYPSGRLAVSIVNVRPGQFTYILQKDVAEADIVAIFQPTEHAVIYHDNGLPRFIYIHTP